MWSCAETGGPQPPAPPSPPRESSAGAFAGRSTGSQPAGEAPAERPPGRRHHVETTPYVVFIGRLTRAERGAAAFEGDAGALDGVGLGQDGVGVHHLVVV